MRNQRCWLIDRFCVAVSVFVQVADNGFVFGVFVPVSWPADAATASRPVADPSSRTFLFSLANAHGRPVKLRLKEDQRDKALAVNGSGYGPSFGHNDLWLIFGSSAILPHGCYVQPESFDLDHGAEAAAGLLPIPFEYDEKLLAGDDGADQAHVYFAAAEIEVYQL